MSTILQEEHFKALDQIIQIFLEDIQNLFNINENLYEKYILNDLYKDPTTEQFIIKRQTGQLNAMQGSGTTANLALMHCLIKYYGFDKIVETGVDSGFSSYMLVNSLKDVNGHLLSIDILTNPRTAEFALERFNNYTNWKLIKGIGSVDYLKTIGRDFQLYVHDSLHTRNYMLKELEEFKKCKLDRFVLFFDDQKSENFWDFCISNGLFLKKGYKVSFNKKENVRLYDHMGGFILYEKERGL